MKIAIAGTGYVGLVTAVALAHIGHHVTCVDLDEAKIEKMKQNQSPIYESDLEELMVKNQERLTYTTNYRDAYQSADAIFIGVGTPEREDGSANLDYVYAVCDQIIESVQKDVVVIIKSTVPIGTNDKIEAYMQERLKDSEISIHIVSNPEFLAQGTAVHDTLYASRIVVGANHEESLQVMKNIYQPLTEAPYHVPYLTMDRRSAEMVKYASNDFLALKISYINEVSNLCETLDADVAAVSQAMGYDPRIGKAFLNPGIGYGGSCFPKDTKALHWLSKSIGHELKTVSACIEVNKQQKIHLLSRLLDDYDDIKGKRIAVLGATFKPGTDDLREAPSIDNIKILLDYHADIIVFDPVGLHNLKKIFQDRISYTTNIDEAVAGADIVLIMTEWKEIKDYPLNRYETLMKHPVIYDGRNCYHIHDIQKTNIVYTSIGRAAVHKD